MSVKNLVLKLKENDEDFEFYPTTKEMVKAIWEHRRQSSGFGDILDIGCGTCNFKKWVEEFNSQIKNSSNYPHIKKYYVIEKSKTLLDMLDKDIFCLGTDFNQNTLIDKKVDTIFCNPPYSEYEEWTKRILFEGNCKNIYLVIPSRWKDNPEIMKFVPKNFNDTYAYKILGSFDFLHAERQARAKVDIVFIDKSYMNENAAFDEWFDNEFQIREEKNKHEYEEEKEKREKLKQALVAGKNKVEILCNSYMHELNTLYNHFKTISTLDIDILQSIGVTKDKVKESLKFKIENLKNLYWNEVFDNLEEITNRLTHSSRKDLKNKFTRLSQVDFTPENIYSLIVWVIKNANSYFSEQLIEFFKDLSDFENVSPYKSNQKLFTRDDWRWHSTEHSHYTLDYRIVCSRMYFKSSYSWQEKLDNGKVERKISDFITIANNLGFSVGRKEIANTFGDKYYVYLKDGNPLFEYKVYKNDNVHIKLNKEFAKALNVEVSRLLGWIRCKEEISKEFPEELSKGAEKYFKTNQFVSLTNSGMFLLENKAA